MEDSAQVGLQDLLNELEHVSAELVRRETRLSQANIQIENLLLKLKECSSSSALIMGNVALLQSEQKYKHALREELERWKKQKTVLTEEVGRAKERLKLVQSDLRSAAQS